MKSRSLNSLASAMWCIGHTAASPHLTCEKTAAEGKVQFLNGAIINNNIIKEKECKNEWHKGKD